MSRGTGPLALLLALAPAAVGAAAVGAAAVGAAPGPYHARRADGTLTVGGLPPVLSHPEVERHLTTGLTTGLVLALSGKAPGGRRLLGGALVDVRWEPWDEVFLVTAVGADGRPRRERVASMARLEALWAALELPMAMGVPEAPWQLELELSVVPFSQSEQRDAQRWFSGALAPESAGEPPRASGGAAQPNGVVDLLIATSIQRRSIVRFEWPLRPRPGA